MGRTEQELHDASKHVRYEIQIPEATMLFVSRSGGATDKVTRNAYIESFVLHLRTGTSSPPETWGWTGPPRPTESTDTPSLAGAAGATGAAEPLASEGGTGGE